MRPGRARLSTGFAGALFASGRIFAWTLGGTLFLFLFASAIGIAFRGLTLYEQSVQAQTVMAKIALERHQLWMAEFKAQRPGLTPDQVKAKIDADAAAVPVVPYAPPATAPAPHPASP